MFYRYLHAGAHPVLWDCTWWCLLRVPPAPESFLPFVLPSASHALLSTNVEIHVGAFIVMAGVFVSFRFLFLMSLKWVSVLYLNTLTIAVFLIKMCGSRLTLLSLLVDFLILRRVFSSFPSLSSFCISCECHCTDRTFSFELISFVGIIRGSYLKSWATIFCKVTCIIIDKPNTPR